MDYKTKSTSRKDLRKYAPILRRLFDIPNYGAFPVLEALDRLPDIFENCTYQIVEDSEMTPQTMARCVPLDGGGFRIDIKNSVYMGAYNGAGACIGFICHEICHVFLFSIGFKPIYERCFNAGELPAYCSVEWQAKALCAEVLIPFEESKGMDIEELMNTYQTSKSIAQHRLNLE